jgi:hypothetical protein
MSRIQKADPIMRQKMKKTLAVAVENAVKVWNYNIEVFFEKFIKSDIEKCFSLQTPFATTGCTGEELVVFVFENLDNKIYEVKHAELGLEYGVSYWVGYAIALFCAETGISVKDIVKAIPINEWLNMYHLGHEYGDQLLIDKITEIYNERVPTNERV